MDLYNKINNMWHSWNVNTEMDIDARLDSFRILFAYNSCRIENERVTYHDTREFFENGRAVGFSGDPRALFEINNQKLCYAYLKSKIAEKAPIDIQLVLETHAILTSGTYDEKRFVERGERPGAFKKHDYIVGREEAGALPGDVPGEINELLDEINAYSGNNILKAAAYFHLKFENIHPFADGNGRVGRALLNYFLMINNHPPAVVFDEDKAAYYSALETYDKTGDISPMQNFLQSQIEKTWAKTLNRNII